MPARILVIEDDPNMRELMTYLLSAFGHTVFAAADGSTGVAMAGVERPDLIVCDIQLPGLDGFGVARMLAGDVRLHAVPLIAVTALAMVGDREKILAAGFDGYLSKPIMPESFVGELERHLPAALRVRPAMAPG